MGILLTESEAAAAGSGTSMIVMLLVYAVLIGAMWFFFMRPQKKEQKRVAASLVSYCTGCLTCRLARCLALSASTFFNCVVQCLCIQCFNVFHFYSS